VPSWIQGIPGSPSVAFQLFDQPWNSANAHGLCGVIYGPATILPELPQAGRTRTSITLKRLRCTVDVIENLYKILIYWRRTQYQKGIAFSMSSFKSKPLSSLLLLGLLAWIAYVLIAPEIDLEDVAFRNNDSPLAIHALSHQVPQGNASVNPPRIQAPSTGAVAHAQLVLFFDWVVEAPSAPPRVLRCESSSPSSMPDPKNRLNHAS
jgi:hypothetical protein